MRPLLATLIALTIAATPAAAALQQSERPTFRAGVTRVSLTATVRTREGRHVSNLEASDFELIDSGMPKELLDFRSEPTPVSLALLVDFSGSMDVAARRRAARDNVFQLLAWLKPGEDQAGLYVFDKQLRELQPLAPAPGDILAQLDALSRPFGVTSLFDAIAETGRMLAARGGARRALVALTDGSDNASRMTPEEVSGIASSIDVPVYVIVVVSPFDRSGRTTMQPEQLEQITRGPLGNLARWTGGEIYAGVTPSDSSYAARQIVTDLRQQYLVSFEPGVRPGWHPIELRTRDRDLVVRARSGYLVRETPRVP